MARPPKRRFALLLAYEGTRFAGWQMQPGARTVQETVGDALVAVGITPRVEGASRTDRGVHARAMVVSITARIPHGPEWLRDELRKHLPDDVRLRAVAGARDDFHAQFSSVGKRYRYRLWLAREPGGSRFAWRLPDAEHPQATVEGFSLRALQSALAAMVGKRSFAGAMHGTAREGLSDLVEARLVRQVDSPRGRELTLAFTADRFGKYMVRTLVGIAARAAWGELDPASLGRQLDSEVRLNQLVAPPQGLLLSKVFYRDGEDPFPWLQR
ncbi:MAG: tRNA pseudouridine synthase A [Deltaproteobacteria bacterium]|nr:tRNA pseudouridine synthase A [Deltaproteobacteria bacterium]